MASSFTINVVEDSFGPLHIMELPSTATAFQLGDLPTMRHFLAAGVASAVASAAFNPLDCLRVRWQLQGGGSTTEQTILAFGQRIVREEGLAKGLWRPGVGANMVGMGVASSIRFGYYETIRNSLGPKKEGWHMVVAGLLCGASAYFVTTPFHLMKTRLQAETGVVQHGRATRSVWQGMVRIVQETGRFSSLYKGSMPLALRGSFFTAGQMVGKLCVACCLLRSSWMLCLADLLTHPFLSILLQDMMASKQLQRITASKTVQSYTPCLVYLPLSSLLSSLHQRTMSWHGTWWQVRNNRSLTVLT